MIDIIVKKYDQKLLIYLGILAVLGTIMLYSASWYESFSSTNGATEMLFLRNHLKNSLVCAASSQQLETRGELAPEGSQRVGSLITGTGKRCGRREHGPGMGT